MKNFYKLFLIPLLVGLIIAVIQYVLPLFSQEKRELSYKIDTPISLIDQDKISGINIKINGEENTTVYFNRILLTNSGQIPLKILPVQIKILSTDTALKIYSRAISTEPKFEFGKINDSIVKNGIRLLVDLMNPKDKITIDLLTNKKTEIQVYSKSEGMSLKKTETEKKNGNKLLLTFGLIGSILSTILAFIVLRKTIIKINVGGARVSFDSLKEARKIPGLTIISAFYGIKDKYIDVTNNLNQSIVANSLSIKADNNIAGDPLPGTPKQLKVVYSIGQEIETIVVGEGDDLMLPVKNE